MKPKNCLLHLKDFVSRNKAMKFILMPLPYRYDLMESSCVNTEIKVFNRKLDKGMKTHKNVRILDLELDRSCFTNHGLHLNSSGKNKIEANILTMLRELFIKLEKRVIPLGWLENRTEPIETQGNITTNIVDPKLRHSREETVAVNSEN
jgi:hypothetical protein